MMKIFKLKSNIFLGLLILIVSITSCKRYSNSETEKEVIPEKNSISKLEIDKILNMKVNLVKYSEPNKYSISIPSDYEAGTNEYKNGDIDLEYGKLNSKNKKIIYSVELKSVKTKSEDFADEEVSIVPEENSNLLTINDIKKDFKKIAEESGDGSPIYYEDSNSIICGEDLEVVCFNYDQALKNYVIYHGRISHFGSKPQNEKLDLAVHLLKNGKNLFKKDYSINQINSWEDYVTNTALLELNHIKSPYSSLNKEIKVFLNINESCDMQVSNTILYRSSSKMRFAYLGFLNAIKSNKISEFNLPDDIHDVFERTFIDYDADYKYTYEKYENVDVIKYIDPDFSSEKVTMICNIDYQGKIFYIIKNNVSDFDKDLHIKMFNYFAKNLTLDFPLKK